MDNNSLDIESGLHVINGNKELNEMCDYRLNNRDSNEVHIYFEHSVVEPKIIDVVDVVDSSYKESSSDDYESAKDEGYKPPPPGLDDESEEEVAIKRGCIKKKKRDNENKGVSKKGKSKKKHATRKETDQNVEKVSPANIGPQQETTRKETIPQKKTNKKQKKKGTPKKNAARKKTTVKKKTMGLRLMWSQVRRSKSLNTKVRTYTTLGPPSMREGLPFHNSMRMLNLVMCMWKKGWSLPLLIHSRVL